MIDQALGDMRRRADLGVHCPAGSPQVMKGPVGDGTIFVEIYLPARPPLEVALWIVGETSPIGAAGE